MNQSIPLNSMNSTTQTHSSKPNKSTLNMLDHSNSSTSHDSPSDNDIESENEGSGLDSDGNFLNYHDNLVEAIRKTVRKEISTIHQPYYHQHNLDSSDIMSSNKRKWSDVEDSNDGNHIIHELNTWKNGNTSMNDHSFDPHLMKIDESKDHSEDNLLSDPNLLR